MKNINKIRRLISLLTAIALIAVMAVAGTAAGEDELTTLSGVYVVSVQYVESTQRYSFSCAAELRGYPGGFSPFTFSVTADMITNSDGTPASHEDIMAFKTHSIVSPLIMQETYPMGLVGVESVSGSADTALSDEEIVECEQLYEGFLTDEPTLDDSGEDAGSKEPQSENPPTGVMLGIGSCALSAVAVAMLTRRKRR